MIWSSHIGIIDFLFRIHFSLKVLFVNYNFQRLFQVVYCNLPLSSLKCLEKLMEETEHIETLQMLITTIAGGSVWFFLRVFNCQKFYNFQSLGMLFCSIQLYLSFCLCLCLFLITANISTVTYLLDHSIVFNTIRVITTLSVVMTLIVGGNRRIKKGKAKICGFTYC